ncbi:HMGL-like [Actinomadura madurae]|uniref:HMGL-like n=1 Tax=Actinomadura madurae TaxID=1993 RepID=A0A1I5PTI9_9ACTN|nr:hypothetical protein [Actinomadura madurae]SFP36976.1 HMGL-like [Actinomadura madurae]
MTHSHQKPTVFTDEEKRAFRADIDAMRRPGAYEPGRWSVSPLNRDPAIVGAMPAKVALRDVTMRSLEALPGVVTTPEAKRSFLRALVASGVPEIVAAGVRGRPVEDVRRDVQEIRALNPKCRVTCPMLFTSADLEAAAEAGFDAVQVWVPPWGSASTMYEPHLFARTWAGEDWRGRGQPADRDGYLERAVSLVARARDLGLAVTAPMLMVSFLDEERHSGTVKALAEAGAAEIALFDGPGAMAPEAMAELVRRTRALAPGVRIGLHPHNTFGLAVAVAVAAARAGADAVEVSVNGYCGGPGNADLAATVAAFEALYGVSTGIDPGTLTHLARTAEAMTSYRRAYNHPVTGDQVYSWGGMDFMTQELGVDSLLHNCISPEWVGSEQRAPLTEMSGPFTAWDKLVELGFAPDHQGVDAFLARVRDTMAERGRLLDDAELADVARECGLTGSS